MGDYGSDSQQHTSAVRQLADARQLVVEAIEKTRLDTREPTRHPNLTPGDGATMLSLANQRLATYLLQLRPYTTADGVWTTDLGTISLPPEIIETSSGNWGDSARAYKTTDPTEYDLDGLSDVIATVNSRVKYERTGSGDVESYRVVLTSSQLIDVYEIADEIARDMDFLADIDTPDFTAGGQGAV